MADVAMIAGVIADSLCYVASRLLVYLPIRPAATLIVDRRWAACRLPVFLVDGRCTVSRRLPVLLWIVGLSWATLDGGACRYATIDDR